MSARSPAVANMRGHGRRWCDEVVAPRGRIAARALHGGDGDVVHLAGGHVVQDPVAPVVVAGGQILVEAPAVGAQERCRIPLGCTMSMDLDEDPLWTPVDVDAVLHPGFDALEPRVLI